MFWKIRVIRRQTSRGLLCSGMQTAKVSPQGEAALSSSDKVTRN